MLLTENLDTNHSDLCGISGAKTASTALGGQPLTLVSRSLTQPSVTLRQNVVPASQNPVPIIRLTTGKCLITALI